MGFALWLALTLLAAFLSGWAFFRLGIADPELAYRPMRSTAPWLDRAGRAAYWQTRGWFFPVVLVAWAVSFFLLNAYGRTVAHGWGSTPALLLMGPAITCGLLLGWLLRSLGRSRRRAEPSRD